MTPAASIDWPAVHQQLADSEKALAAALHPTPERILAILAERADTLRRHRDSGHRQAPRLLLAADAGEERLAWELSVLKEVISLESCTFVPGGPLGLLGLANLRGDFYSVLDPRLFLDPILLVTPATCRYGIVLRHPTYRVILGVTELLGVHPAPVSGDGPLIVQNRLVQEMTPASMWDFLHLISQPEILAL